jgi:hypothetical protein
MALAGGMSRWPGDRAVVLWPVLLSALPMVVLGWARYRFQLPSGDEPHYLAISQALTEYGSLDVARVYAGLDYWSYYPQWLQPHVAPGPDGAPLPLHSIGGPVLWLVPFALWGRAGVIGFMTAVSLLIVANVYWLVRALDCDRRTAVVVATAFGVGTPVLTYSAMSFVEPLGALGCVYAVRLLQQPHLRTRDLLGASAVLGALPWVHSRFLLFPPVLLVFLAARVGRDRRRLACALVPAAVSLAGLELYNWLVWHSLELAPNQLRAGEVPLRADPLPGLLGTVLDQEAGVVPNFPVFLFVLPGLVVALSRRYLALDLQVLALVLPYVLVVCSFPAWAGAWSPPARFAAVVLPVLAGHVALALQRAGNAAVVALAAVLAAFGGLLTFLAVWTDSGGFSAQGGSSPAWARLDALTRLDLARFVPSSALAGQQALFAGWLVAVVGFAVLVGLRGRRARAGAPVSPEPGR